MRNFNQDNRQGGRRDFGDRSSNRASMHQAICSSCGKECQVPFKPTGSKPVYCSECFEKNGGSSSKSYESRSSQRPSFRDREMFEAICDKCGNKCKLPFKPTSGKPIYCSSCFEAKNTSGSRYTEPCQCKGQLEALNAKLDKILKLLTPVSPTDIVQEEKSVKPKEKTIAKKKTKVSKKTTSAKKE